MNEPSLHATMPVPIQVNGEIHLISSPPGTPLLWVLRDELRLKGTKYGCGMGICGACTVQVDGAPLRSCVLPVETLGQRAVRTIEDRTDPLLRRLREAWASEDVPQCGYCQSGQLASAAVLLRANPTPDDAAIDLAMRGNLCRCGTYARIRAAIHRVAAANAGGADGEG